MRRERLRKLKDFIILGSLGRTQHTAGPHGEAPELVRGTERGPTDRSLSCFHGKEQARQGEEA